MIKGSISVSTLGKGTGIAIQQQFVGATVVRRGACYFAFVRVCAFRDEQVTCKKSTPDARS